MQDYTVEMILPHTGDRPEPFEFRARRIDTAMKRAGKRIGSPSADWVFDSGTLRWTTVIEPDGSAEMYLTENRDAKKSRWKLPDGITASDGLISGKTITKPPR